MRTSPSLAVTKRRKRTSARVTLAQSVSIGHRAHSAQSTISALRSASHVEALAAWKGRQVSASHPFSLARLYLPGEPGEPGEPHLQDLGQRGNRLGVAEEMPPQDLTDTRTRARRDREDGTALVSGYTRRSRTKPELPPLNRPVCQFLPCVREAKS